MPNELNIAARSGLTVTAQRYQSGAAVGSAISLTEVGSSGFYTGNMTGTAGTYQLAFLSAGANIGAGSINWDGTAEVASSAPTAADNASAVWAAAARTITGGTVTTLTNAPTVPSAASIASATRTELATELSRIDASVSSRLAASAYTAPTVAPTAAQNASAVRTELSVELARVDAAVSTRATPANIPTSDITAIKSKTDALPASPAAVSDIPTASENANAVWNKSTTELTVSGSIGERSKNQSTVSTTGAQLAAALS